MSASLWPLDVAHQAPLSSTISWRLLEFISIELVMDFKIILCLFKYQRLWSFSCSIFSSSTILVICWQVHFYYLLLFSSYENVCSVWNLFSAVFTTVSQAPRRMIGMTLLNRLINKTWGIHSFLRGILSFFVSCHWFLFCPLVFYFCLFCFVYNLLVLF